MQKTEDEDVGVEAGRWEGKCDPEPILHKLLEAFVNNEKKTLSLSRPLSK